MELIKNFFVEPDLKNLLEWLGINYKKSMKNRIILSLFFASIFIFLGIYFKSLYLGFVSVFVGLGYYKYQYFSVKKRKKQQIALKKRMFPAFVKKILILIRTNNVYTSFLKMIDYTDEPIKSYLIELVKDIENDKSVIPFNIFANKMEFDDAFQIMSMLYTFSEHAMSKNHLARLESKVSLLYDNEIDDIIESKKRLLWLYPNFCIVAMLGLVFSLALYMFVSILSEVNLV